MNDQIAYKLNLKIDDDEEDQEEIWLCPICGMSWCECTDEDSEVKQNESGQSD